MSSVEHLLRDIRALKLPEPVTEYRFHELRRWRFDLAWPPFRIAAEYEGLTQAGGRHQRIAGFAGDCEKYNEAALGGWAVFRFTARMVKRGDAVATLEHAFAIRGVFYEQSKATPPRPTSADFSARARKGSEFG